VDYNSGFISVCQESACETMDSAMLYVLENCALQGYYTASRNYHYSLSHRRRLRVASGATAPVPVLERAPHFKPKVVLVSLSSIPVEIPILWPHAVMVGPRPRVLLTPPLR
jgi:hypothetical protein